ncbi:unnamed protein product [Caenorhabditis angaria]|uniref:Uncharacterized protein n=1 Tax=Caenorhabditis angaria TaxID=860376 RepID=A0A9P1ISY5_9PELO|nr:unnamed protein product [Caenorhabditis angaria]
MLDIIFIIFGTFGHFLAIHTFWNRFSGSSRIILVTLSLSMIFHMISSWSKEIFFESLIRDYVSRYSYMMSITLQQVFSLDRLVFIKFPKFYKSIFYTLLFIIIYVLILGISTCFTLSNDQIQLMWLVLFSCLIIFKLPMELIAMISARRKYAQTTGANLNQRFDLSISYEITKSFVLGTIFNIFLQILLAILAVPIIFEFIDESISILSVLHIIVILEMSMFPWIVLITNKKWRNKIITICNKKKSNKVHVVNLKGQSILTNPSQKDYFDQLEASWNI